MAGGWAWQPVVESFFSGIAVLLWALLLRRGDPGTLARYSLSSLGLGLLLAASGLTGPLAIGTYRMLLLLGLAAGDLFFWYQLGLLGRHFGPRRSLGLGLGASLLLIGLANLTVTMGPRSTTGPHPLFLLAGAAILFAVIPLIFGTGVLYCCAPPSAEVAHLKCFSHNKGETMRNWCIIG